jgi:aspartyl protease family protein
MLRKNKLVSIRVLLITALRSGCLSRTQVYKQGKLTDDDIRGTQQYQIADGSIREGIVVVLRKVEIGNKVLHDVKASIVDNENAPLLLGQSALSEFGKVSIDYKRNEITFE